MIYSITINGQSIKCWHGIGNHRLAGALIRIGGTADAVSLRGRGQCRCAGTTEVFRRPSSTSVRVVTIRTGSQKRGGAQASNRNRRCRFLERIRPGTAHVSRPMPTERGRRPETPGFEFAGHSNPGSRGIPGLTGWAELRMLDRYCLITIWNVSSSRFLRRR